MWNFSLALEFLLWNFCLLLWNLCRVNLVCVHMYDTIWNARLLLSSFGCWPHRYQPQKDHRIRAAEGRTIRISQFKLSHVFLVFHPAFLAYSMPMLLGKFISFLTKSVRGTENTAILANVKLFSLFPINGIIDCCAALVFPKTMIYCRWRSVLWSFCGSLS